MFFFLLRVALVLAIAIGGGAYSAKYAIENDIGIGSSSFSAWTAHPGRGSPSDDPYSRARLARSGEIALGQAEGIEFTATQDDAGRTLQRGCAYRLSGSVPPARYWTLYAVSRGAARIVSGGNGLPSSLNSRQLMRRADNSFDIVAAPEAQPGNWLPLSGAGAMQLVLTLYDTPASTDNSLSEIRLPEIIRGDCGA